MNNELTIIMYHYVRPLAASSYPRLKALDLSAFVFQLEYLRKNYDFVSVDQVIKAVYEGTALPSKATYLTFDDCYKDHYEFVFPELEKREIPASFFAPAGAIKQNVVLDVNKIHFILAACNDENHLFDETVRFLTQLRKQHQIPKIEDLTVSVAGLGNRYDSKKVKFIKQILQNALPEHIRKIIINFLLQKFVGQSESELSSELYMNLDQIHEMQKNGMNFGAHGYEHYWLEKLNENEKRSEIRKSNEFLDEIGAPKRNRVFCYPYGSYDEKTIDLIKDEYKLGLTTRSEIANLEFNNRFELPRLDTNDFPQF